MLRGRPRKGRQPSTGTQSNAATESPRGQSHILWVAQYDTLCIVTSIVSGGFVNTKCGQRGYARVKLTTWKIRPLQPDQPGAFGPEAFAQFVVERGRVGLGGPLTDYVGAVEGGRIVSRCEEERGCGAVLQRR
jgi:hypothetical protein